MNDKGKFRNLAITAARVAHGRKGLDIVVYDIEKVSPLSYYSIIISTESPPHMNAIVEEIKKALKKTGVLPLYKDGEQSKLWKILDFGGLMVHIFEPETRLFYALDKIYYGSRRINWRKTLPKRKKRHADRIGK